jgi:asparagine synthase (glutamine-hydrolysing)
MFAAMDQPSIDGVNTWFVARAAAQQGIKAALSGVGGDELLGSYPSFRDVPRLTRLAKPFTLIPGMGRTFRRLSHPFLTRLTSPKYAGLLEYGTSTGGAYLLRRGLYMHWEMSAVLDPELARAGWRDLHAFEELNRITLPRCLAGAGRDKAQQRLSISALEMNCYMRNQLLRDTDWAGMAHSLEIRVPFVDIELLKISTPWLAVYPDIGKSEIAARIAPNLPAEVLNKPKTGFSVPVREWLLAGQPLLQERGLRGWARYVHRTFAGNMA